MDIFTHALAGLISLLVVVLGGHDADVSSTQAVEARQEIIAEMEDPGFIDSLRESLIQFEGRLRAGEDESVSSDDASESETEVSVDDSSLDNSDDSDDSDEDESEDEDDDDSGRGGQSAPRPTPAPTASTQVSFTLSDVAKHNTATSCYSAINGSVYDLTSWISGHPGGQAAITSLCGVDGSSAFNAQHGSSGKPNNTLAGFKVGVIK